MNDREQRVIQKMAEGTGLKKPAALKRQYSLEKKLQVLQETLAPGASASIVARRHGGTTSTRMWYSAGAGSTCGESW
jgi:transposase-like protein